MMPQKFISKHLPYITDREFTRIMTDVIINPSYTKNGAFSKCHIYENYAILNSNNIFDAQEFKDIISTLNDLKIKGVSVARILGYAITETNQKNNRSNGYIVQEKAKGNELLYCKNVPIPISTSPSNTKSNRDYVIEYCKLLRTIPQKHFDKYLSDYKAICDAKIKIDPLLTNLFYDKKDGFTFIDLNTPDEISLYDKLDINGKQSHRDFLKQVFNPLRDFGTRDIFTGELIYTPTEEKFIIESELLAFEKLFKSAIKIGIPPEDIQDLFRDYKVGEKLDLGFKLHNCKSPVEALSKTRKIKEALLPN